MAGIDAERASMRLQLLHIEHHELVRREESLHRQQREVREVLVVNGVELIACNQPHQMRKLYRDHPTGRQQNPQSGNEVVEGGYLGEHVIPDQQVSPPAAGRDRKSTRLNSSHEWISYA